MGIVSAKILGIPIISTCHGFIENDRKLFWYNKLDRFALRFFNRIIAVSDEISEYLQQTGVKKVLIKVIPNGVKTEIDHAFSLQNKKAKRALFNIREKDFVLGYIGRLSQEKGIEYLIHASSMLEKAIIPIKILLIGDGPQKETLKALAKENGLGTKVFFPGFQSDIEEWIPALDVFILPSFTEGTPMSLLEAMAYGIPVVASAVGGVPKIIDSGKTGILVSPGRPKEIRDNIVRLYDNPSLRNKIGKAGQQKVKEEFDVESWARQIEAEYISLIKNRT